MSGWPRVALSAIATPFSRPALVEAGTSYRTIGVKWWGEGAYERQTIDGSQTAAKSLSIVRADDLIINKIWVRHGSTAIATKEVDGCAASNEFPTFRLDKDAVHPRWIHWLTKTKSFWNDCDALSMGTSGKNRIKPEKFLTITIPLPPLTEQRRLVAKIDALAAKIEEAKRLRDASSVEMAVIESHAVTHYLDSTEWPLLPIEELVGRANLKNGKSLKATHFDSSIRCLTLSSMRNGVIDSRDSKPVPMEDTEAGPYRVYPGDVFVSRGNGSKHLVGRAGLVEQVGGKIIFPDLFIRIPIPDGKLLPEYFVTVWNSPRIRARVEDLAKTTSGIWKVNQGHISSISIPVPPLRDQARVVRHIREITTRCKSATSIQAVTQSELDALLPAILDRAFRGEL